MARECETDEEITILHIIRRKITFYGAFLSRDRKVPKRTRPEKPMVSLGTLPFALLRFPSETRALALRCRHPLPFGLYPARLGQEYSTAPLRNLRFPLAHAVVFGGRV